ncbi:hypothetical protein ACHAQH_000662 [Verticillium albo-atrum]
MSRNPLTQDRRFDPNIANSVPKPTRVQTGLISGRRINKTNTEDMNTRKLGHIRAGRALRIHRPLSPIPSDQATVDHNERIYNSYGSANKVPAVINPFTGRGVAPSRAATALGSNILVNRPRLTVDSRSTRPSNRPPAKPVDEEDDLFGMFAGDTTDEDDVTKQPKWTRRLAKSKPLPRLKVKWDLPPSISDDELEPQSQYVKRGRGVLIQPSTAELKQRMPRSAVMMTTAPDGTAQEVPRRTPFERLVERGWTADDIVAATKRRMEEKKHEEAVRRQRESLEAELREALRLQPDRVVLRGIGKEWHVDQKLARVMLEHIQKEKMDQWRMRVQCQEETSGAQARRPGRTLPLVRLEGPRRTERDGQWRSADIRDPK